MKRLGLQGIRRGKVILTTVPDKALPYPLDRVNRKFKADRPNKLWVSDFTYVSTWQGAIRGLCNRRARQAYLGLSCQQLHAHGLPAGRAGAGFVLTSAGPKCIDPSLRQRSAQYVSIPYTERLAQAGIELSVGRRGDRYDNALTEKTNGLYKAELIQRCAPWKTKEAVELAILEWVKCFYHIQLLEPVTTMGRSS
jgi:putative transposase